MKWNVKNSIGRLIFHSTNPFLFDRNLYSRLKKVQEKKKQARALQEKKRAELIESGALTGGEEEAPSIFEKAHDDEILF